MTYPAFTEGTDLEFSAPDLETVQYEWDWTYGFRHFNLVDEICCKCEKCVAKRAAGDIVSTIGFKKEVLCELHELRIDLEFPLKVTSGYRCSEHPIEKSKSYESFHAHTRGIAVDIAIAGENAHKLVFAAYGYDFNGVGVKQNGDWNKRFIHIDFRPEELRRIWSY